MKTYLIDVTTCSSPVFWLQTFLCFPTQYSAFTSHFVAYCSTRSKANIRTGCHLLLTCVVFVWMPFCIKRQRVVLINSHNVCTCSAKEWLVYSGSMLYTKGRRVIGLEGVLHACRAERQGLRLVIESSLDFQENNLALISVAFSCFKHFRTSLNRTLYYMHYKTFLMILF